MSTVLKCDRCDNIYTTNAAIAWLRKYEIKQRIIFSSKEKLDLCPSCYSDLCSWASGKPFRELGEIFKDEYFKEAGQDAKQLKSET